MSVRVCDVHANIVGKSCTRFKYASVVAWCINKGDLVRVRVVCVKANTGFFRLLSVCVCV